MISDVNNTIRFIGEIHSGDNTNEKELIGIIKKHLEQGNHDYINAVTDKIGPNKSIFFLTLMKDVATLKEFTQFEKSTSCLYVMPLIAIQDKNTERKLSEKDVDEIKEIMVSYTGGKYEISILDTVMTPFGLAKEPIEINTTHDCVVLNPIKYDSPDNLPKRIRDFYKSVREDEKSFFEDEGRVSVRYLVISAKMSNSNVSITDFTQNLNNRKFIDDIASFLSKKNHQIGYVLPPISYTDGIEIGLAEFHHLLFQHKFKNIIESQGINNLDIVFSQNSNKNDDVKVSLIEKESEEPIIDVVWPVILLTDKSFSNAINRMNKFCKDMGFSSYLVDNNETKSRMYFS